MEALRNSMEQLSRGNNAVQALYSCRKDDIVLPREQHSTQLSVTGFYKMQDKNEIE